MHHDAVFKALADPTRRAILRILRNGELTAGELAASFDITAPSMSHHFNVLKQADLIYARRDGQQLYYALNTTVFQDALTSLLEALSPNQDLPSDSATYRGVREPDSGDSK